MLRVLPFTSGPRLSRGPQRTGKETVAAAETAAEVGIGIGNWDLRNVERREEAMARSADWSNGLGFFFFCWGVFVMTVIPLLGIGNGIGLGPLMFFIGPLVVCLTRGILGHQTVFSDQTNHRPTM